MKKGFTLIELLAVIVVLSIIALIAVPKILKVFDTAEEQGKNITAEAVIRAMGTAYMNARIGRAKNSSITIQDILDNTTINNELTRDSSSITTNDGVKCTIIKNNSLFVVTCVDTNSDNKEILTNNLNGESQYTSFTGTIYRHTSDNVSIGDNIFETDEYWCATVSAMGLDSCVHNEYYNEVFSSQAECQSALSGIINYPEATPDQVAMAQAAECEKRTEIQSIFVSGYETSASNIQENFYLKHIIVNNTVSESYACMRYNTNNEICLRGGDMSYYGTYDGMSSTQINSLEGRHPTKNFAILESIRSYFEGNSGLCFFDDNQAGCYDSSLCLSMTYYDDDYIVSSNNTDGPSIFCYVDIDGSSECS